MSETKTEVQILTYLVEHPSASDTIERITEWWLLEQRIETGIRTVRAALESLVEMGFVLARKRHAHQETYSVHLNKIPEIHIWLDSQSKS